jgi:hypothetical protein
MYGSSSRQEDSPTTFSKVELPFGRELIWLAVELLHELVVEAV